MTDDDTTRPEHFRLPLEFILTEHDRQRVLCAALERLGDHPEAPDTQENAAHILRYLTHELPHHIADEEEDLFPLLRRRATADDGVEPMLEALHNEHATDDEFRLALEGPLRAIAAGETLPSFETFRHQARAFAELHRRHLAWENGALLPLARKRLSADDLLALGRSMAARRGIVFPE